MLFFQMAATDIPCKEFKTQKPTLMHLNNKYKDMGTAQQLELLMQSICRLNPRRFLAKAERTSQPLAQQPVALQVAPLAMAGEPAAPRMRLPVPLQPCVQRESIFCIVFVPGHSSLFNRLAVQKDNHPVSVTFAADFDNNFLCFLCLTC